MKALFTYLTGGRSGQAVSLDKSYALLGRAPHADVRFGPDHDLAVSARHAAVVYRAGTWVLRDLASTNGTFVNGDKVEGERPLADQDLIRLGDGGPLLRFGVLKEDWSAPIQMVTPPAEPPTDPAAPPVPPTPIAVPASAPAIRGPARTEGRPWLLAIAAIAAVIVTALLLSRPAPPVPALNAGQQQLIVRADSLFSALDQARRNPASADQATALLSETARLRSRIRRLPRDAAIAALSDSLANLEARARQLGN